MIEYNRRKPLFIIFNTQLNFIPEENAIDTFYTDWVKIEPITISSYSGLQLGGWNSDYGSCLDVDVGTPYGSSALRNDARRPLIDVFFEI